MRSVATPRLTEPGPRARVPGPRAARRGGSPHAVGAAEPVAEVTPVAAGVTLAAGFRAAGVHCGIRRKRPDLALIVSDRPASAAAVFTRNLAQAAPILVSREHLAASGGTARAIVVNSGNANACTGDEGLAHARLTAARAAELAGVPASQVLVASTGVIGQRLPIARVLEGLPRALASLSRGGGTIASEAILTTDLRPKTAARTVRTG